MLSCFLPEDRKQADYLDQYYEFWHRAFPGTGFIGSTEYDRSFAETAPGLGRRYREIRRAVVAMRSARSGRPADAGELGRLPAFLRGWSEHCLDLRERAVDLAGRGDLLFAPPEASPPEASPTDAQAEPVTDLAVVLPTLLSPYMHMTNNRLHVTIRDEAYLAHVLGRVLRADQESEHALAPVVRP